ncbi:MAG: hypothetical protein JWQ98_1344 [Chlorobi bacterium]|nr:hypothetical protein [Chlorobiota bacterium]
MNMRLAYNNGGGDSSLPGSTGFHIPGQRIQQYAERHEMPMKSRFGRAGIAGNGAPAGNPMQYAVGIMSGMAFILAD